jgi:aspartate/methionine/tyrosine aminotransferase
MASRSSKTILYGRLRYEGEHLAPLVVLDRENLRRDNGFTLGNVIYLSTFSKTLAPGIRLAWIVAPEDVISKLVLLKQAADLQYVYFQPTGCLRGRAGWFSRSACEVDSPCLS